MVLFILFRIMLQDKKLNTVLLLIGSLLICVNFGLIDRFIQDDNSGIQDRVEMQSGTLQYVSEDSIINNIFGRGYDNFVVKGNEVLEAVITFFVIFVVIYKINFLIPKAGPGWVNHKIVSIFFLFN